MSDITGVIIIFIIAAVIANTYFLTQVPSFTWEYQKVGTNGELVKILCIHDDDANVVCLRNNGKDIKID